MNPEMLLRMLNMFRLSPCLTKWSMEHPEVWRPFVTGQSGMVLLVRGDGHWGLFSPGLSVSSALKMTEGKHES